MSIRSKSKASALSAIPWGQRKQRSKKPVIPWATIAPFKEDKPSKNKPDRATEAAARQACGQKGEDTALQYLMAQGLTPLARNYRCRCGELDLVMQDGETAVVVEVRVRTNHTHGDAASSITHRKQTRVSQCAQLWWVRQGQQKWKSMRFDVIAISNNTANNTELQWIQNAWLLSD